METSTTTAPTSIKEFKVTSCELEVNKKQLIEGFQLLHSPLDIQKLILHKSVKNFFSYLKWFRSEVSLNNQNKTEISEFFLQHDFHQVLLRFGEYFSETKNIGHNQKSRNFKIFMITLNLTNFLTGNSRKFCTKFFEIGGARWMINLLANGEFIKDPENQNTVHLILLNITLLSNEADFFKQEWFDYDAVNVLLKVARVNELFKRPAYSSVLKIANDSQISEMYEISEICSIFINALAKASEEIMECIKKGETVVRGTKEFSEGVVHKEKSKSFQVYIVSEDIGVKHGYPVTSIINTIYKLSVNDKIKYDLYFKYNVKDPLRVFLIEGSDVEKRYALKLLTQLCFDPKVQDDVAKDDELMFVIESQPKENILSRSYHWFLSSFKLSKKFKEETVVADTLVNDHNKIEDENEEEGDACMKIKAIDTKRKNQIMISYNSASRDLCIKIKQELESIGLKVWIDVDDISGSSLESMANAVETSEAILMCVTEKYRQSNNCQAEAQYAFKLKKPIIPLIMQENYDKVGGWLGIIMGDKIYINFKKLDFEEAVNRLKHQLSKIVVLENKVVVEENTKEEAEPIKEELKAPSEVNETETEKDTEKKNETIINVIETDQDLNKQQQPDRNENELPSGVITWSDDQVKIWFVNIECGNLYQSLKPCNGELLYQLYEMWNNAPEFFYQFISLDNKLDRHSLLTFTSNLKKVFKD